ncbi:hypothetical protein DKG77_11570 [Flagellimonas aquimarina]|uniref:HTH LytTR-type domain-containing protein n=1 Tax=Flagellimonas aquimarina TaxID=2201895 RepID=A0A316L1P6_9FLAO|nr:LytTR family DNA-binding domain-containing protein [Allomuricauda koreensis]PWL38869.1 hypothetical protein DKG77_11570 [Allomuricauda koreensis]
MTSSKNIAYWRVIEPILLGSIANIIINFIFNPTRPDFILKEFLIAIMFAMILTETNRVIDFRLEKKLSWTNNLSKRFLYQLMYLTIALLVVINVIGNTYTWLIGDGFYSLNELLVINLCVFVVALLLTFFKWSVHFYKNWISAEHSLTNSAKELDELKSEFDKSSNLIELQKGNGIVQIKAEAIRFVKSDLGIIWVYYDDKKAAFNGTLVGLMQLLPQHLFFQATRNTIIRQEIIMSITPSTYGKIDLKIKDGVDDNAMITISRLKAASFRKWRNSTSN